VRAEHVADDVASHAAAHKKSVEAALVLRGWVAGNAKRPLIARALRSQPIASSDASSASGGFVSHAFGAAW
jgi:hypothetical protein